MYWNCIKLDYIPECPECLEEGGMMLSIHKVLDLDSTQMMVIVELEHRSCGFGAWAKAETEEEALMELLKGWETNVWD